MIAEPTQFPGSGGIVGRVAVLTSRGKGPSSESGKEKTEANDRAQRLPGRGRQSRAQAQAQASLGLAGTVWRGPHRLRGDSRGGHQDKDG